MANNTAPLRLLRIATDAPPPIILDQRDRQVIYTYEQDFRLTGTTQPDVRLLVNGSDVQVDIKRPVCLLPLLWRMNEVSRISGD